MLVEAQVSSMNTSRSGSRSSWPSNQASRRFRMSGRSCSQGMQLFDAEGRRLYFTEEERRAFAAAAQAPREVRTFCGVLHATGCRISEALALTAQQTDLSGRVVVFESLKKRKRGVFRAVPVPPELLDTLDMVHGIR